MIQLETHSDNGTRLLQMSVVEQFLNLGRYPRDGAKCSTLCKRKLISGSNLRLIDKHYFKIVTSWMFLTTWDVLAI